jgi:NitT/TauT family transport system substrate-binding protein
MKHLFCCVTLAALAIAAPQPAHAEQSTVKILVGKPLGYLGLQIMQHEALFEKHAAALGIPRLKVQYVTNFTGSNAVDALLSGSVDIVQYSPDVLLTLWSKTVGTPQEIRGLIGKGSQAFYLNTRNPNVHSVGDFTDSDRIAVPGVKVSGPAIWLEMTAEKVFGPANWEKLDHLTITLGAPDAYAQLLSPISQVSADFNAPPFAYLELQQPSIHRVLTNYEAMGGPTSSAIEFASKKFHDANPKICAAFIDAMSEAIDIIKTDHGRAIAAYRASSGDTTTKTALIEQFLDDPNTIFELKPRGIMKYAAFMKQHGLIARAPATWKDVFFEEAAGLDGN